MIIDQMAGFAVAGFFLAAGVLTLLFSGRRVFLVLSLRDVLRIILLCLTTALAVGTYFAVTR